MSDKRIKEICELIFAGREEEVSEEELREYLEIAKGELLDD